MIKLVNTECCHSSSLGEDYPTLLQVASFVLAAYLFYLEWHKLQLHVVTDIVGTDTSILFELSFLKYSTGHWTF